MHKHFENLISTRFSRAQNGSTITCTSAELAMENLCSYIPALLLVLAVFLNRAKTKGNISVIAMGMRYICANSSSSIKTFRDSKISTQ